MKKIINKAENIVREMCEGIVYAHPQLEWIPKYNIIKRSEISQNKVGLISGGGSGHEPAHAGYVGKGMLDAAVCGDVFASPSQIQVYQAIKSIATDKGVLLVVKNYSGDIMNFQNAVNLAREDGILVEYVKVDDDIAVEDSLYTVGRRGVAGTVFVHKIAGAAAEQGKSLAEVKQIAEKAAANVRSIGLALTSCTVPAKGSPTFELAADEIEYGVGIHGEPGISRIKHATAEAYLDKMVNSLVKEMGLADGKSHKVAVMINGFGATPLMELYLTNGCACRLLKAKGVQIACTFVGNFMTSIDMAGFSVSLLKLDEELEALLNCACSAPAFQVNSKLLSPNILSFSSSENSNFKEACYKIETPLKHRVLGSKLSLNNMIYIVDAMAECIIKNEVPFCELDSHAGDGDFGMSVAKGFRQLKAEWQEIIADSKDIGEFLGACSMVIMEHCGGASGPIWGSAFRAAGKFCENKQELDPSEFSGMMFAAIKGIQQTGERSFGRGAELGDKTLIDALIPAAEALQKGSSEDISWKQKFANGAAAAVSGAKETENIVARMGRAGTVGERSLGHPDAGAFALGVIFADIANAIEDVK